MAICTLPQTQLAYMEYRRKTGRLAPSPNEVAQALKEWDDLNENADELRAQGIYMQVLEARDAELTRLGEIFTMAYGLEPRKQSIDNPFAVNDAFPVNEWVKA